jgi:dTDP-glucose 4,6-dehydratase/UDP-glucose 4-epimerase
MMKILIVGSKGFIGGHLYDHLLTKTKYEVFSCDVMVDYVAKNYFLVDSTNADFSEIFQKEAFDYCINCSGAASVPDSLANPLRDFTLNTFHVVKMLDSIRRFAPACRFINLSSAAVYGNPRYLPITEDHPCLPVSPYGIHKNMAEEMCTSYFTHFGVGTSSLRIFSAYGPKLKKQIFWDLFMKSRNSTEVKLFGTGKETRDFIFIDDIVSAVELIIEKGSFDASKYNIASGRETTINEIAQQLLASLNYSGKILFSGDERAGDPSNWVADISKITQLGFVPAVSLDNGINKMKKWLSEEGLL